MKASRPSAQAYPRGGGEMAARKKQSDDETEVIDLCDSPTVPPKQQQQQQQQIKIKKQKRSPPLAESPSPSSSSSSYDWQQKRNGRKNKADVEEVIDLSSGSESDSPSPSPQRKLRQRRLEFKPITGHQNDNKNKKKPANTTNEMDDSDHSDDSSVIVLPMNSIATKKKKECPEKEIDDFLKWHCWTCKVPLHHPTFREKSDNPQEPETISCYALHSHPLLGVPVCCVCSEAAASLEVEGSEAVEADSCCVCARSEGLGASDLTLLLCDQCSRGMCANCVKQSHGNEEGVLENLLNDESEWKCCKCQAPKPLESLQQYLHELAQSPMARAKTADELCDLLGIAEQKKRDSDKFWENSENIKQDIWSELYSNKGLSGQRLEEEMEAEYDLLSDQQEKHEARLVDMINSLVEELSSRKVKELKVTEGATKQEMETYERNKEITISYRMIYDHEFKDEESEPSWKSAADIVVDKRRMEELEKGMLPDLEGRLEMAGDIEELSTTSSDSSNVPRFAGPRRGPPAAAAVRMAMDEENVDLTRLKMKVAFRRTARDDRTEMQEEARASSALVGRRDHAVVVRQRKEHSKRPRSSSGVPATSKTKPSSNNARNTNHTSTKRQKPPDGTGENEGDGSSGPEHGDMDVLREGDFEGSCFRLSDAGPGGACELVVAEKISKFLKPHQKEGITFMYRNCFGDLGGGDASEMSPGGCILAHNMGLGKSLSAVALLHAMMFHPSLHRGEKESRPIRTALLVVPVNTLANWENEFAKWTSELQNKLQVHNLSRTGTYSRTMMFEAWTKHGGVLLTSAGLFQRLVKLGGNDRCLLDPGPDVVILDEAHTMLNNKDKALFKALDVRTKRRICLTGSPFQNNLFEYFRMITYVRPGLLGNSEAEFRRNFQSPIIDGQASDAVQIVKDTADEKLEELKRRVEPYVHRKSAAFLRKDLPPMHQVVLHLRKTKLQNILYNEHNKFKNRSVGPDNFLRNYNMLRPINNHPGVVLTKKRKSPQEGNDDDKTKNRVNSQTKTSNVKIEPDEAKSMANPDFLKSMTAAGPNSGRSLCDAIELLSDAENDGDNESFEETQSNDWWGPVTEKGYDLGGVAHGNKTVILLHILAHASLLNEKVLLFTHCLRTMDFLISVLASPNWKDILPSLVEAFPDHAIGGWKEGKEFLRLDGSTSGTQRGDMIDKFNDESSPTRLFIISSKAGAVGINLCSASRVVLYDSSFNPTTDSQATYRCYRYGQTKKVFVYRFLTANSLEEKLYKRIVSKDQLAQEVIDGKNFPRIFTRDEMENLNAHDEWVMCDHCNRWRMLPPGVAAAQLPDKWYCHMMGEHDKRMVHSCDFQEQGPGWYLLHYKKPNESTAQDNATPKKRQPRKVPVHRTIGDKILEGLVKLKMKAKKNNMKIVQDHYLHDNVLEGQHTTASHAGETDTTDQNSTKAAAISKTGSPHGKSGTEAAANRTRETSQNRENTTQHPKKKKRAAFVNEAFRRKMPKRYQALQLTSTNAGK